MLRVGQHWCDPDGGLDTSNPAAENYQDPETAAAMAALQRRWVDRDQEQAAVLRAMSDLTGLTLENTDDFSTRLRDLHPAHAAPQETS